MRIVKNEYEWAYYFDSVVDMLRYISTVKKLDIFNDNSHRTDPLSESEYYKKFSGTRSYAESEMLALNGCPSIAKKIIESSNLIKSSYMAKNVISYGVYGYAASVPRYVTGLPDSMICHKPQSRKQIIDMFCDIGFNYTYTADDIVNRCIYALSTVKKLDDNGIKCNVYVCANVSFDRLDKKITSVYITKIKGSFERLDIDKISYPMCHPSFLRRQISSCIERDKNTYNSPEKKFLSGTHGHLQVEKSGFISDDSIFIPTKTKKDILNCKSVSQLKLYHKRFL